MEVVRPQKGRPVVHRPVRSIEDEVGRYEVAKRVEYCPAPPLGRRPHALVRDEPAWRGALDQTKCKADNNRDAQHVAEADGQLGREAGLRALALWDRPARLRSQSQLAHHANSRQRGARLEAVVEVGEACDREHRGRDPAAQRDEQPLKPARGTRLRRELPHTLHEQREHQMANHAAHALDVRRGELAFGFFSIQSTVLSHQS